MSYTLTTTNRFDKDLKRCAKRGLPLEDLKRVIDLLQQNGCLTFFNEAKYYPGWLRCCRKGF